MRGGSDAPSLPVGRPQSVAEGAPAAAAVHAPGRPPVHARRDARGRARRGAAARRRPGSARCTRGSARTSSASRRPTRSPTTTSRSSTRSSSAGIDGEISVKPTQLGLDLDADACLAHLVRLAEHAAGDRLVPVGRHGGQRLRRAHDRALRAAPRGPAADRDLPPGLPPPDRRRHRARCCRSTRPSASSRAPTTRPERSPTRTGASVDANYVGLAVAIPARGPRAGRSGSASGRTTSR